MKAVLYLIALILLLLLGAYLGKFTGADDWVFERIGAPLPATTEVSE